VFIVTKTVVEFTDGPQEVIVFADITDQ